MQKFLNRLVSLVVAVVVVCSAMIIGGFFLLWMRVNINIPFFG